MKIKFWNGEKMRWIRVGYPCPCGCDFRDNPDMAGYITGSDPEGNGFTITLDTAEDVVRLKAIFEKIV